MIKEVFYSFNKGKVRMQYYCMVLILILTIGAWALVYMSGGVKYVYVHSMYVPIFLASVLFGVNGGVLVALVGGILLGPLMPVDIITSERQDIFNWLYRIGFFTLIAFLVGSLRYLILDFIKKEEWSLTHDVITGLPNRVMLNSNIQKQLDAEECIPSFLFIFRIGNFEQLDTYFGSECIDEIMVQMERIIRNQLPYSSDICRIDDDRLGLVYHTEDENCLDNHIGNILQLFSNAFVFNGLRIQAEIYSGGVKLPSRSEHPGYMIKSSHYIQRASHAARKGKESGRYYELWTNFDDMAESTENLKILGELKHAFDSDQLVIHYQPKVEGSTGMVESVEALIRWQHPERGNVPPGQFIPYVESSNLIHLVTHFVIDQSLRQLVEWKKNGLENLRVAVNVSTKNLMSPNFYETVAQLLEFYGVGGEHLELEITESSFFEDMNNVISKLDKLNTLGVNFSIDDFGTGYSSLKYLAKLPISTLKLDRSFVQQVINDQGSKYIVEYAINLAHNFGIKVCAEGVEDRTTYDFLVRSGCDLVQGYYVSHPVPSAELEKMYKASKGRLV